VRLLNGLLLLSRKVQQGQLARRKLMEAKTVGDVVQHLPPRQRRLAGLHQIPPKVADKHLGLLMHPLLEPEPRTGCVLHPGLLLRHAASRLYQEAHLLLERDLQLTIPGLGSIDEPVGHLPPDARFTPPNMARALAQKALEAVEDGDSRLRTIVVLDPACGSGIFLLEFLRELLQQKFKGKLRLVGYDKSDIAVSISRFCLETARGDAKGRGIEIEVDVSQMNALTEPWEAADVVLMNPPFVPFDALAGNLEAVKDILGTKAATGRVDMAMAFVTKAVRVLRERGTLAAVLPVPLLANESGSVWREELALETDLLLLGRFEGYGYFAASMVETAFVLLKKKDSSPRRPPVQVVIAREGWEDLALRSLRSPALSRPGPAPSVEVFTVPHGMFVPSSWLPLRKSIYELRESLAQRRLPTVGGLFAVHQGARTGDNRAFIISASEWAALPDGEQAYFRPTAGQGTIRDGRLISGEYAFYPYGPEGARIADERTLRRVVPTFYGMKLLPRKTQLERRARVNRWWLLTHERSWQWQREPKIVATYFGLPGSFSYDQSGDCAVVQGHAWLWKKLVAPNTGDDLQRSLHETPLPWAYVALLNSTVFGHILACYCPRVQGGQFDLSPRFVKKVPLPNLGDAEAFATGVVEELADVGRRVLQEGAAGVRSELDAAAARAYGLPASLISESRE
jgi:predicted RNA methylase